MLEDKLRNILTVKAGLKEVAQGVDPTFITDSTAFVDYPEQFEKVVASAEHFGHTAGVDEENLRWTNLVNSATATAEDVAKGKTFVGKYGEIKDGTLDVEAIKEEGKKSAYDEFWDRFQLNGTRENYQNCFAGQGWSVDTFKPKYPIIIGSSARDSNGTFAYCNWLYGIERLPPIDMSNFEIDFSNCTILRHTFKNANIKNIFIDASNVTSMQETFDCSDGGHIDNITIKISEKCTQYSGPFYYTQYLTELTFVEGSVIAANGVNLQWSKDLTKNSVVSVINVLSRSTSGLSVILSKTAVNKAFETSNGTNDGSTSTEWLNLIATRSNWTISLA